MPARPVAPGWGPGAKEKDSGRRVIGVRLRLRIRVSPANATFTTPRAPAGATRASQPASPATWARHAAGTGFPLASVTATRRARAGIVTPSVRRCRP